MKNSNEEILILRQKIDLIHSEILELLLQRNELAESIWNLKKVNSFSLIDENRESEILQNLKNNKKLNQNFELQRMILNIFESILKENKNYLYQKMKDQNELN